MSVIEVKGEGYIPAYTRNDFAHAQHDAFGLRTDYQINPHSHMKKIFRDSKK
jgi:hypothetical protein